MNPAYPHPPHPLYSTPNQCGRQESALGRLSGGVLGKKRFGKSSGKSPVRSNKGDGDSSAPGGGAGIRGVAAGNGGEGDSQRTTYVSMASMGSTTSVGGMSGSEVHTPGGESVNSEASSLRTSRANRYPGIGSGLPAAKPPPGPSLGAAAARRTHLPVVEPPWAGGGALSAGGGGGAYGVGVSQMVGTRSGRRNRRRKKDSCDVS